MIKSDKFRDWLKQNTVYSESVIRDTASRMKRADSLLEWNGEDTYLFYLEKNEEFKKLSVSVRSQIRKAIRLYEKFSEEDING